MKVKCIIVEDEPKAMSLMEDYVNRTPFLQLVSTFHTATDAIRFLNTNPDIQLLFLDINLPEFSGMDMAKLTNPSIKIVFTTAYSDFAVNSYEVNTIDYLLKPITYTRFLQAATKVKTLIEKELREANGSSHVFVKSGRKMIQISWDDIYFIEALKEYVSIVTPKQKVLVYKRMSEIEAIHPKNFKRVHNSFIVNLDKVEKVEDQTIYIFNQQIPISRSYKDDFFAIIKKRSF